MFQYYLRAEGLALSWIGSGRLIFSLNYTEADFDAVADRFVAAAKAMQADGWWWSDPAATNKSIRRGILREILTHRFLRKDVTSDPGESQSSLNVRSPAPSGDPVLSARDNAADAKGAPAMPVPL